MRIRMRRQMNSAGGSKEPPPFFFRHLLAGLLALLPLSFAATAPHAELSRNENGGYRLAGVMRIGNDRIGFLEVPSGGQVLVRVGTLVDGGKVTVFNDREVRIAFPGRTVLLQLAGDGGGSSSDAALGVVTGNEDNGHVMVREVDSDRMSAALHRSREAAGTPGGQSARQDAAADLGRRFAAIANLPLNARVVAVNDQPVVSADKAIAEIDKALSKGQGTTLNLEAPPGEPPGRV
jgi:hypothetical protein